MKENQTQCQLSSSFTCDPHLPNPTQAQASAAHGDYHMPQPQEAHDFLSIGGSSNPSSLLEEETNDNKWMSSKMRWMRKMMINKQRGRTHHQSIQDGVQLDQSSSNNNDDNSLISGIVRVCSNCRTTKTPLWRSGPQGPKSLCNACGIRQMKARRAMRANVEKTIPFKKRFKNIITSTAPNKNETKKNEEVRLLEEVTLRKLAFPQEDRDAAILLMALSCGLIHG